MNKKWLGSILISGLGWRVPFFFFFCKFILFQVIYVASFSLKSWMMVVNVSQCRQRSQTPIPKSEWLPSCAFPLYYTTRGRGIVRLHSGYEISSQERITIVLHKASSIISLNVSNWQFWLCSVFRMRSFFHEILHVSDLGCTLAKVGFFTAIKSRGCKQNKVTYATDSVI